MDVLIPLSIDELSILQILADAGARPMAAIGRWKNSVLELTKRGFLKSLDPVNYVITDAGRKALRDAEAENDRGLARAINRFRGIE